MNVNVYLEDVLAKQITQYAKSLRKPRNTIIREALKEFDRIEGLHLED